MSFGPFVQANVTVDPNQLLDNSIDVINSRLAAVGLPGWSSADADLAVILLGVVAQMAADVAQVAATILPAVFRSFGAILFGIPFNSGAAATVSSTWNFTSPAPTGGYEVTAGTAVLISGYAFYVQTTVTTNEGDTSATIQLVASAPGTLYNDLGGISQPATPNEELNWVAGITLAGTTSGGADQETDDDYQNRLASVLRLQAPRPITAGDYSAFVQSDVALAQTGIAVGRATSIDGFYPQPRSLSTGGSGSTVLSCTIASGSPTVTVVSTTTQVATVGALVTGASITAGSYVLGSPAPTPGSFTLSSNAGANTTENLTLSSMDGYGPSSLVGLVTLSSGSPTAVITSGPYLGSIPFPGATVTGLGVPASTTVLASPAPTATGFTMSHNASGNETSTPLTISEWQSVSACVTTFCTDDSGLALSAVSMDTLSTWLQGFRELNFLAFVEAPTYSLVYVTAQVAILPGFIATNVVSDVQSALMAWLNPQTWGQPSINRGVTGTWLSSSSGYATVRFNSVIGIIEGVPGVQYAINGGVTLGLSPSPAGVSDLALGGPAPLATSSSASIVVTSA